MENKRVLVIGGSGYLGKEIVTKLLCEHYKITILSRNPKKITGVSTIKTDVMNKEKMLRYVKEFDIVIYLAAVIRSFDRVKYRENIGGLKNTLEVMNHNKISRIIYFSTQNVYIEKTGPYGSSKKECEKLIFNSGLDYIIVRPNYVYGIDKRNDFYRLIKLIKTFRICPVIGNGNVKFQPVNKNDVARITAELIKNFKAKTIIDISGNETITINNIIMDIKKVTGLSFITVHIPIIFLQLFRRFIPFDVIEFTSDRLTENPCSFKIYSNIREDLKKILQI